MPNLYDLDAAMMQPDLSVPAVRRLGGGTIRHDDTGRPLRTSGRNAVVYELQAPTGRILALRCLLRPDPRWLGALANRYAALHDDPSLEDLRRAGGALPGDIRWIDEGIAYPGPDLRRITEPLVAMERVPGRTLLMAVDRLCREGHAEPLALLADAWLATATMLDDAGFTHGDLAADNLMVRPDGTLALVDLDTAAWPSLDLPAVAATGAEGYLHPRGAPEDPARRDRFAALILWASLRILARHPGLRERWGDRPDRDGTALLWSQRDLRRAATSPLFAALDALHDEPLLPLLEIVRRALRFSPDDIPPLPEIAERLATLGLPRLAASPEHAERRARSATTIAGPAPQSTPFAPQSARPSPPRAPTTTLVERDRRIAAAQQLGAAIAARDRATAVRLWEETSAIPQVAAYAAGVHELVSRDVTATIDRAMRRNADEAIVAAIAEAERAGVAPSPEARAAGRGSRARLAAATALQEAIARDDLPAIGDLQRAGHLACLGRLQPAQARAVARALAWPVLERALASDDDAAIVAAADPALWRDNENLSPEAWQRLDLARRRLRWLEDVRAALRQRDTTVLRGLLTAAPPGAEKRLTEVESRRLLRLTMREAAVSRLERALREGPDREVVAALAEFESAGAPFSAVLDWTAVRGVVDRITLADAIRAAAAATPPDTARLARLLPAARAALGEHAAGGPDWAALEASVLRSAHLERVRDALAANDDGRIASAASPDPYDVRQLLAPDERERVARALARARVRQRG